MLFAKRTLILAALIGLLATPSVADEIVSLKGGYYKLEASGDVGFGGEVVDIEDDLGIDDDDGFFAEAALHLGDFRLFTSYQPISFSGSSVLSSDLDFNGETFVAGSRIDSDLDIDIYEAGLTWFLINLDDLPVRIQFGPEVAVKYIDTKVEIRDKGLGLQESESVGVPIPSLGARARIAFADYLGVVGRVCYLEYNGNSLTDIDAQVEYSPIPLVGIYAGYRYLEMDIDEDDLLLDAKFSGPHAGALIRF
jgi:outer membrane protein